MTDQTAEALHRIADAIEVQNALTVLERGYAQAMGAGNAKRAANAYIQMEQLTRVRVTDK